MPQYRRKLSPDAYRRLVAEAKAAATAQAPPPEEPGVVERYAPPAIRGIGMLLGLTPARGLGASAIAETLAQGVEGRFSPAEIGVAGVTGGLGGAATSSLLKNISKPLVAGLKGAAWGGLSPVAREASGKVFGAEDDYEATPKDVVTGGLVGGGVAGGLAKLLGGFGKAGAPKPISSVIDAAGKPIRNILKSETPINITPRGGAAVETPRIPYGGEEPAPYRASAKAAQKAEEKAAQDANNLTEIEDFKNEPGVKKLPPSVRRTVKSGDQTLLEIFKKRRQGKAEGKQGKIVDPNDISPEDLPENLRSIYDAWLAKGREHGLAIKLAMEGRAPRTPVTAADATLETGARVTPQVPRTPEEVRQYIEAKTVGEAPTAGPEPPLVGKREGMLAETSTGASKLQELEQMLGREIPTPQGARGTMPAETSSDISELLQIQKSPVDVMGQAYRGAKGEAGINPLAKQYLGASLGAEAQRAGLPTKNPKALEALQKLLGGPISEDIAKSRLTPDVAPQGNVAPPQAFGLGIPAGSAGELQALDDVTRVWADETNKIGFTDPETKERKIDEILRGLMGGEKGAYNPELAARLGLAAGGAALGGATAEDPTTGAILGGTAGFMAPSLVKLAQRASTHLATDPTVSPTIKALVQPLAEGNEDQVARSFWSQIPSYLRAGMLMGPNLPNNVVLGPWSAGMSAGLELKMAGDPIGDAILTAMSPANWMSRFHENGPEAARIIRESHMMQGERFGTAPQRKFAQWPGQLMLQGDITTRTLLQEVGLSEELARRYTSTSEPVTPFIKGILNLQRGGGRLAEIALPFAKTLGNLAEQGAARTPILGKFLQKRFPELAYSPEVQQSQQVLGAAVPTVAGGLGYYAAPEENDPTNAFWGRFMRSAVSNAAGPYAGLAAMGFGVGKSLQNPETKLGDAALRGVTEAVQTVPLPTAGTPLSYGRTLRDLLNMEVPSQVPSGVPAAGILNTWLRENRAGTRQNRRNRRSARGREDR